MSFVPRAEITPDEFVALLESRVFAYQLLSRAFIAEPTPEYVRALGAGGAVRFFPFGTESERIERGTAELSRYLNVPDNMGDDGFAGLLWDYTRLFIGPARPEASPNESVYLTEDRLLLQEQTLAVRRAYLCYGYMASTQLREPDDHIGLELDFMNQTCRLAMAEAEVGRKTSLIRIFRDQLDFLEEHLLTWGFAFSADVESFAQTGFYRGLVLLLAGFLETDRIILQELVSLFPQEE